jgi:hypothetical protein
MVVTHHDHVLRWLVTSRTRGAMTHLVDLGAIGGHGECSCEHFQFTLRPQILGEAERTSPELVCGHIIAAQLSFARMGIQGVLQREPNYDTERHTTA